MFAALQNFVVFKTYRLSNDDSKFKGVGGQSIMLDTTWDPKKHVNCSGEVVSVPRHLSQIPISQKHRGLPAYDSMSPYTYRYVSDIPMEIKVGDTIYFHFNTIVPNNKVKIDTVDGKKVYYFKVRVDQIICAVRDGKIIPVSSYTLIEPDKESWDDILKPVYSNIKGPDGKYLLKPKEQWIQTKIMPDKRYLLGFVRHVGSPMKGDTCDLVTGDKILYRRYADWTNKIEGQEYFAILQRHIIGRFVDGQLSPIGTNIFIEPEVQEKETEAGVHKVKGEIARRGTVIHKGKSSLNVGDFVEFGDCDRQPIDLDGKHFISMDAANVWGIHLGKSA
jgi:co-chaperonin GroES (HSP10)